MEKDEEEGEEEEEEDRAQGEEEEGEKEEEKAWAVSRWEGVQGADKARLGSGCEGGAIDGDLEGGCG